LNRPELFLQMLDSTARLQRDIAHILEAKVVEAEKSRNWICNHLFADELEDREQDMRRTGGIHDHLVQVIDGITKMENALVRNLQALLKQSEGEDSRGPAGIGDPFSMGERK
jgi:predicted AAA+ superfamily ATPase